MGAISKSLQGKIDALTAQRVVFDDALSTSAWTSEYDVVDDAAIFLAEVMRICFLMRHLHDGYSGGAEIQMRLYSQALAQRGWEVWVIGEGFSPREETVDAHGVRYVFLPPRRHGFGVLNYYYIKAALKRIRPQICYQRVKEDYTYWAARLARRLRSRFLFAFSHDDECCPRMLVGMSGSYFSRTLAFLADQGIRMADLLVCQTEEQRNLIGKNFARNSIIIKNGHPLPDLRAASVRRPEVLWINNLKPLKQPELFFQLASALKNEDATFCMIGAPGSYSVAHEAARARCSHNFYFCGEQSLTQVNERLWGCCVVVNTSRVEGFPNTFIQAWARLVPVISLTVDPDGVIEKQRLGFRSGDFSQLVSHTRALIRDQNLTEEMGRNGRLYVEKEHDLVENAHKLDQLLRQLA